MLKYDSEHLLHMDWDALTPPEYRALDESKRKETQDNGRSLLYRTELIARDGERLPVIVQATRLDTTGDLWSGVVLNARGLTNTDEDFERLAGRLLNLYDDERRRIARELHDTTAQNLAALSMNLVMLGAAQNDPQRSQMLLEECNSLTDECLREVRSLSYMLHPPLLDELGLESALRAFVGLYERRTGVAVDLFIPGPLGSPAPEVELGAFRVAQEALFNVNQHSESKKAEVELSRNGDNLTVVIRDWGKGIDARAISGKSLGIAGMRERVRLLGGHLEIRPAEPGTRVRAVFPVELR